MNRRQRIAIIVGAILIAGAIACPPWSYYRGEVSKGYAPGTGPAPAVDAERDARDEHPLAPAIWIERERSPAQIIRGLAVMAFFAGTVLACVALRSRPGAPGHAPAPDERPRRAFGLFWTVVFWTVVAALAVPVVLLLAYLIRLLRG